MHYYLRSLHSIFRSSRWAVGLTVMVVLFISVGILSATQEGSAGNVQRGWEFRGLSRFTTDAPECPTSWKSVVEVRDGITGAPVVADEFWTLVLKYIDNDSDGLINLGTDQIIVLSGDGPEDYLVAVGIPGFNLYDQYLNTSDAVSGCYGDTVTTADEYIDIGVLWVTSPGYTEFNPEGVMVPVTRVANVAVPFTSGRLTHRIDMLATTETANVAYLNPTNNEIFTSSSVSFDAFVNKRAAASDLDYLEYAINRISPGSYTPVASGIIDPPNTGNVHVTTRTLSDGLYEWYIPFLGDDSTQYSFASPLWEHSVSTKFFGANHWYSSPGFDRFFVDTTPPVLSNLNHTPSSPTSSDPVTVSVTAQDVTSGLSTTKIYVDDVLEQTCTYSGTTNPQTCQVIVGPYASGTHSYYAVATDFGGLQTTSSTQNFTIATTPPVASNLAISYANYCYADHTFTWDYFDSGGDPQGAYQLQVDDEQTFGAPLVFDSGKVFSSSDQRSSTVSVSPTGEQLSFATTYYWRLTVWDDQDVPSVSWAYPVPPTTTTALHPYPTGGSPPFDISPIIIVQGETITFTDATTFFTAPANQSWQWTIPNATFVDGTNASSQNPHATFDTGGGRTVLLQATDEELAADPNSGTGSCTFSRDVGVFSTIPQFKEIAPIIGQ